MKLAYKAYFATLILLTLAIAASAQGNARSDKDRRNTAPTVGTGGSVGGPTGLFTVYDGETLRKGEYTLSAALSNYDRDPGNVDITSVPLSFQIGVSDHFEFFFATEAYRGIKINSPRNLSSFYLPNSQVLINGTFRSAPAIILAPRGPGASSFGSTAVFRPTGLSPLVAFPYTGGNLGTFGLQLPFFSGPQFGFAAGTNAQMGPPIAGGVASAFPGVGSVYGSILPGVVLRTISLVNTAGQPAGEGPSIFTTAPSYLPDAPFDNRTWGQTAFNSFDAGFKWRVNDLNNPIGWGFVGYYRWYTDKASTPAGFNQMQRGAGPGGSKGDIGLSAFVQARLAPWANLSGNVGLVHNSNPKATFPNGEFTLLDRGDEFQSSIGLDMPVNKYFQYILEFRALKYIGGRTPNAFENNPIDGIAGLRVYPKRWLGFGAAYRYNFNQQSSNSFNSDNTTTINTVVACRPGVPNCTPVTLSTSFKGIPPGFDPSSNPHGYIAQMWIGRRDARAVDVTNVPGVVDSVNLGTTTITLPCRPGTRSRSGACNDTNRSVSVETKAHDQENDVLTYNYTVSGGRIVGSGANVQWDLAGAQSGTYTITTGVDDGCGVCGKTETRTITVRECPDCEPLPANCTCPSLSMSGPGGVTTAGDTMTFIATVTGGTTSPTYTWQVSAGSIESGQGTPSIVVRTTSDMAGGTVTATVTLGNLCDSGCTRPASETAPIAPKASEPDVEEFGAGKVSVPDDEVKAWIDIFYKKLNPQTDSKGYIINYGTPAEIKKRRAQIEKGIAFLKYDRSRVTFIDGDTTGGFRTKFIIVPPGVEVPKP